VVTRPVPSRPVTRAVRTPLAAMLTAALAVALAITVGPACSIDSRSDDFRCGNGVRCDPGRDCVDGYCVVDPSEVDGGGGDCPAACSRCEGGTCFIDCDDANECVDARVACPDGMPCEVTCSFAGSCAQGVSCGDGACTITCSGPGSCDGDLDCSNACACTTTCPGAGACTGNVSCPGPGSCRQGGQCTAQPGQCDRC